MKLVIGISLALVLLACNSTYNRTNIPGDQTEAVAICKQFDTYRLEGNRTKAIGLSGGQLTPGACDSLLMQVDTLFGKLISYELNGASSDIAGENGKEKGEFVVNFDCVYEKGKATEEFVLYSKDKGKPVIEGLHIKMK